METQDPTPPAPTEVSSPHFLSWHQMELPCSLVITLSAPLVSGMEMLLHLSSDYIESVFCVQIRDVMVRGDLNFLANL
ncbi:hypothetical protein ACLKA6_002378 [Drosophila palustris]